MNIKVHFNNSFVDINLIIDLLNLYIPLINKHDDYHYF